MSRSRAIAAGGIPRLGRPCPRAFVLIAVIIVAGVALLVTAGILMLVRGETAGAATLERSAQSRALAWSGVQAIGTALDDQRAAILAGEAPTIDGELIIYESGSRLGVIRLLPVEGDNSLLAPQNARVDLTGSDATALTATGLVDSEMAGRIIAHRGSLGGRFQSELELLSVPGISTKLLFGELLSGGGGAGLGSEGLSEGRRGTGTNAGSGVRGGGGAGGGETIEIDEMARSRGVTASARGLMDVVTVHGYEPMLQRSGASRIQLVPPWTDAIAKAVTERFGEGAADGVRGLMERPDLEESLLGKALAGLRLAPRDWVDPLDVLTTEPGEYHGGRIDINRAPYEVLLAVAGMTAPQAAEIVRQRESLSAEERSTPVWPLLRGIVEPEEFGNFVHRLTVRSWLWRVRLVAGEVAAETPEEELAHPIIWEVVFDLSTPRWRIAYMRDITLLPTAAALAASAMSDTSDDEVDGSAEASDREMDVAPSDDDSTEAGVMSEDDEASDESGDGSAAGAPRGGLQSRELRSRELQGRELGLRGGLQSRAVAVRGGLTGRGDNGSASGSGGGSGRGSASEQSPQGPPSTGTPRPAPARPTVRPVGRWRT